MHEGFLRSLTADFIQGFGVTVIVGQILAGKNEYALVNIGQKHICKNERFSLTAENGDDVKIAKHLLQKGQLHFQGMLRLMDLFAGITPCIALLTIGQKNILFM